MYQRGDMAAGQFTQSTHEARHALAIGAAGIQVNKQFVVLEFGWHTIPRCDAAPTDTGESCHGAG